MEKQIVLPDKTITLPPQGGFVGFWLTALGRAVSAGWGVFGVVTTILPDGLVVLQKGVPTIAGFSEVQWLNHHPVQAHLSCALAAIIAYAFYAPYRLFKTRVRQAQGALQDAEVARKAEVEGLTGKLETQRREAEHASKFALLNFQRVESDNKSLRDSFRITQSLLADRQYDRAKAILDEESEREKQRLEKREACLSKCQDILRHNSERPITLAGLLEAGADKLDTTDDMIWLCNELAESSGNFMTEYGVVPPNKFLDFLREIRARTVPANEIDTRQKCANFCFGYYYEQKDKK